MALKTRYSPLQHFSLDNLYNTFVELPPRNKLMALGAGGLAVLLLLFLPLSLASGKIRSLRKEIVNSQRGYHDVMQKVAEYEGVKGAVERIESRLGAGLGSLTSKVEGLARDYGITVSQLKEKPPNETDYLEINSVELRASGVTLDQLIDFLSGLENDRAAVMRLRRIQVKPKFANRQLLDVTCEIATFLVKKEI